uniref:Toll-like receptor n=1 Tax=Aulactinia veratra TaxID=1730095 RepID=A0A1D6XRK1_AULVR|nr:Toll-like receptor [Aulactinia veratra]
MSQCNFLPALVSIITSLVFQNCYAADCKNQARFMPWRSIYENVDFFITRVDFTGGKNCEFDFGPHLNRTDTKDIQTFDLVIGCMKPAAIKIKNPSNIQRKNVISYLEVGGPCEVDLEGVAVYANATDYRVQAITHGATLRMPNSSQEVRHLQSQIKKIGTLTLDGNNRGIPNIYVKYNWSYMAEVRFINLSIKHFPITLRHSMPRLQGLELPHNELEEPPDFPWAEDNLYLPCNLTRKAAFNEQYQDTTSVQPNIYRRFLNLDYNRVQNLSRFEFRGHLKKLSIQGNGLKVIGKDCLVNLTGINAIDLSINKLNMLPQGIFRGLKDLFDLRLNENNISVMFKDTFKDTTRIKTLYLNNNKLERIPKGFLLKNEELQELHLENNLINKLEYGALPNNSNKLKVLFISRNRLRSIPQDVFLTRSLENVYLTDNFITFESIIETLDSIFIEELLNVLRKSVSEMSIELRTDSIYIYLANNRIKSIDINDLNQEQMMKLKMILKVFKINLENNPLLCDCRAIKLTRVIKELETEYPHIKRRNGFQSWICQEPPELKGKEILTIPEDGFVCVKNLTGCPKEGTCSVRATDGSILIDIRNKNLKRLPLTMPVASNLELFLENNHITELSMRSYLDNVTVLRLSHNNIQKLNGSFVQRLTKTKIREFRIDSNKLKRLPRSIELLTSRNSFELLAVHSNFLICDCHSSWMKEWLLNSSDKIYDVEKVKCSSGKPTGKAIYSVPLEEFTCESGEKTPKDVLIIISITLAVLLVICIAVFLLVYFFRGEMKVLLYTNFNWHPFDRVDDSDPSKLYDAFISYSSHDREWVHNELKQKLEENDPPYRICVHDRDFEVGAPIHDNIINSVNRSKRMIMVLSDSFLKSEWCMLEFRAAHHKVLQDKTNYLIIILFEGIDPNSLDDETKLYLTTNTYLSVTNKWFWKKLLYSLPKPKLDSREDIDGDINLQYLQGYENETEL